MTLACYTGILILGIIWPEFAVKAELFAYLVHKFVGDGKKGEAK
jgi:hypothetical protein